MNSLTKGSIALSPLEVEFCRTHDIPLPTDVALDRLQRMLVFRNSMHLYHGTCALSGKKILTSTPPTSGLTVYDVEAWSTDAWDAADYARAYDFSRPFFAQFADLMQCVPFPSLGVIRSTMENSDYTNDVTSAKNCYLLFGATENENCLFSHWLWRNRDIVDSIHSFDSELCYECRDIRRGYRLTFCDHCDACAESTFLSHCVQCRNCYGCVNLRHKQFCYQNEQLSQSDYGARLAGLDLGAFTTQERERVAFVQFKKGFSVPEIEGNSNETSSGNYLQHTKNCNGCFFVSDAQDCESCIGVVRAKNCILQTSYGDGAELVYHSTGVGDQAYNIRFSWECWMNVSDLEYCMYTSSGSTNCFGCIGLKHKSYCILNRQYSKSEYEESLPRIRAHMRSTGEYGQFFPAMLSPHAYNQSWADHFLSLSRSNAIARGFRWNDDEESAGQTSTLPEHINDVRDAVLSQTFACSLTGKPYRINRAELDFYRKMHLPLPRVAPLERIKRRAVFLSVTELRETCCSACGSPVQTAQSADHVMCQNCFGKLRL